MVKGLGEFVKAVLMGFWEGGGVWWVCGSTVAGSSRVGWVLGAAVVGDHAG